MLKVAIIGGGAAGCFAAVNIKEQNPDIDVTVYEAGAKLLAKVAVTGGGRCNLTNSFAQVRSLESVYPRGHRLMKRLLKEFSNADVCDWFEARGIRLLTQPDQCVFPVSQDAMEIVNALLSGMRNAGVHIKPRHKVLSVIDMSTADGPQYKLSFAPDPDGARPAGIEADIVLVTTGGSPKKSGLSMLDGLGLDIIDPLPSLFSFNIGDAARPGESVRDAGLSALMGTVVGNAMAGIVGTKFRATGPLLITDWGMSGPAILKLSSYAARYLADNQYNASLLVSWLGEAGQEDTLSMLADMAKANPQKQLSSIYPEAFNNRLWNLLLHRAGLSETKRWAELGSKGMNRLAATLTGDIYPVVGRNRFKGEFVTCGGVSLSDIDPKTLECRSHSGLYFAGEVLDIDAITGGFNLQAAWSTGFVAARSIISR